MGLWLWAVVCVTCTQVTSEALGPGCHGVAQEGCPSPAAVAREAEGNLSFRSPTPYMVLCCSLPLLTAEGGQPPFSFSLVPRPSSLLCLLPPHSVLLSPSSILLDVLKLLTRFPQWPGAQAPPSPPPHPHPREQLPDFPGGAKWRRTRVGVGWGVGRRAALSRHCHTGVTHPRQCQGLASSKAWVHVPYSTGGPVQGLDSRAPKAGVGRSSRSHLGLTLDTWECACAPSRRRLCA